MANWVESEEQLTYEHLLEFTSELKHSQGFYSRAHQRLLEMDVDAIDDLNDALLEQGYKNDLMTIIEIFEG